MPPRLIPPNPQTQKLDENECVQSYRQAPFALQAIRTGQVSLLNLVLKLQQRPLSEVSKGYITLSTKNKNIVNSNGLGCAAFYGKHQMLRHLLENCKLSQQLDQTATEEKDYLHPSEEGKKKPAKQA